jgi:phosphatidylserine decarboxylase
MAKEGILFVVIPFLVGVILLLLKIPYVSFIGAICFYVLVAYMAFFFRDPSRTITAGDLEVVSPVDGRVLEVIGAGDETKISIFLSLFDVHVNRLPYKGLIKKLDYHKGKFLPAYRDKASEVNERINIEVEGQRLSYKLRLITGIAARRIRMWIKEGEQLDTGDKIGIMLFGSRAEVFLPPEVEVEIKAGDKVYGGLTLLGKIAGKR